MHGAEVGGGDGGGGEVKGESMMIDEWREPRRDGST